MTLPQWIAINNLKTFSCLKVSLQRCVMKVNVDFTEGGALRFFLTEKGAAGQISLRNTA